MKKRRSEGGGMEDVERSLHTSFCTAANSISHLYTQAQNQQKVAFQAGQRHSLEKLYDWIQKHHQQHGTVPSTAETLNYLKMEMENVNQTEITVTQVQSPVLHLQQLLPCQTIYSRLAGDQQRLPSSFQNDFSQAESHPALWTGK
ncbi:hypothetical protein GOP47_0029340 [Adiantum capillus-veneris]|nr:hypothetical protein GOP47_0029340 [Adiantum capillus-veneris]